MRAREYDLSYYQEWRRHLQRFPANEEFSSLSPVVLAYLDGLDIKTVITEEHYIDADYSSAYSRFYSRRFNPPPSSCKRHLFFSQRFRDVDRVRASGVMASFKGYLAVWPTTPPVIGRSVLPFPRGTEDGLRRHYIKARYRPHVAGAELPIESAMFAGKDHGVSVCATIATWLATDILHRKHDLRTCSSAEVTLLATGKDPKWGRPLPQDHGLTSEQIVRALYELDYGPHVYDFSTPALDEYRRSRTWVGVTYGYVCSDIPVIILCDVNGSHHVVLAVGLEARDMGASEKRSRPGGTTSFAGAVESFVVHDDRYGLFGKLKPGKRGSEDNRKCKLIFANGYEIDDVRITGLIVPLPPEVVLLSDDAHLIGVSDIQRLLLAPSSGASGIMHKGPYQTLLKRSVEFKESILRWEPRLQAVGKEIRNTPLPKWVWVTEAYSQDVVRPDGHTPLARVILDSTKLHFSGRDAVITGHIDDQVIRRSALTR